MKRRSGTVSVAFACALALGCTKQRRGSARDDSPAAKAAPTLPSGCEDRKTDTGLVVLMTRRGSPSQGVAAGPVLSVDDVTAIQSEVPGVCSVAPSLRQTTEVSAADQIWRTGVVGTTADYLTVRGWTLASGTNLGSGAHEVILGQTTVRHLFDTVGSAVGATVQIKGTPFKVVGVLAALGESVTGFDQDDVALIPVASFQAQFPISSAGPGWGIIFVAAATDDAAGPLTTALTSFMRARHHLEPGQDDDFTVRNLPELKRLAHP